MLFRDTSLSKGDGFLALFAINSLSSWYSLKQLRAKIVREHDDDETIPMVIIANKTVSVCVIIFSGKVYVCVGKWLHIRLIPRLVLFPSLLCFCLVVFCGLGFTIVHRSKRTALLLHVV